MNQCIALMLEFIITIMAQQRQHQHRIMNEIKTLLAKRWKRHCGAGRPVSGIYHWLSTQSIGHYSRIKCADNLLCEWTLQNWVMVHYWWWSSAQTTTASATKVMQTPNNTFYFKHINRNKIFIHFQSIHVEINHLIFSSLFRSFVWYIAHSHSIALHDCDCVRFTARNCPVLLLIGSDWMTHQHTWI